MENAQLEEGLSKRHQLSVKLIKKCGEDLLKSFKPFELDPSKLKSPYELVTEVDKKFDKLITDLVLEKFPKDGIHTEEGDNVESQSGWIWYIDPLDGTTNFIRGIPHFGLQIALEYQSEVVSCVINVPTTQEVYTAIKNRGAFCNNASIKVSNQTLDEALLIYGFPKGEEVSLALFEKLHRNILASRSYGVAVIDLPYVASGRADILASEIPKAYDIASGSLLIEEAGGKVTDFNGNAWNPHIKTFVATNGKVHEEVLSLIGKGV